MDNNLSKQEKFLKHQHSLYKSVYWFLYSLGTFCLLTAWGAFTYHNHPAGLIQGLTYILLAAAVVSGFFLVIYLLVVGKEKLFWRQELSKQSSRPFKRFAFYSAIGYLLFGVCLVMIVFSNHLNAKKCDDVKCFLAVANNCDDVILKSKDKYGLEWSYSASSCKLEKKLVAVDKNENVQMKSALEGKSVTCTYTKDNFNEHWVSSVMGDLDTCEGDLRDTIGKLLLFF